MSTYDNCLSESLTASSLSFSVVLALNFHQLEHTLGFSHGLTRRPE